MAQTRPPPPSGEFTGGVSTILQGGVPAILQTLGTVRDMKIYALTEGELRHVTWLNSAASVLFSIATVLVLTGGGLLFDLLIDGRSLAETIEMVLRTATGIAFGLALILYCFGVAVWLSRRSELGKILRESREFRPPN